MVIDKHPGPGHAQKPGKEQAVNDIRQAPGPAPPLMIFFQPVGIGFLEKLHSCLAGSLAAALCHLAVFLVIFAGANLRRRHPGVTGRSAHPTPELIIP